MRQFPTILLAYRPEGFPALGGIRSLALRIATRLREDSRFAGWRFATWQCRLDSAGLGLLPGTIGLRGPGRHDVVLVFGCDRPWAYRQVLALRLLRPGVRVLWLPSFHDPSYVRHPLRARGASWLLRQLQRLGTLVLVQTEHERHLLDVGRCALSNHAMPKEITAGGEGLLDCPRRAIDLMFLGRPTAQKGWPRFLELVQRTGLSAAAIVPTAPDLPAPSSVALELAPDASRIREVLADAKLVLIPSDYESFGLAQVEAVACGCLVPVLGRWPLWDGFPVLHWQHRSSAELAQCCLRLCANEPLRQRLAARQGRFLREHPVLSAPFLPGL